MVEAYAWIMANYQGVIMALFALLSAAELIVRMTPTKKDDSAVEKLGKLLKRLMDFLRIPNVKVEDGRLGLHKPDFKKK